MAEIEEQVRHALLDEHRAAMAQLEAEHVDVSANASCLADLELVDMDRAVYPSVEHPHIKWVALTVAHLSTITIFMSTKLNFETYIWKQNKSA